MLNGAVRPKTGIDVIGLGGAAQKVLWNERELRGGAALKEKNAMAVGQVQKRPDVRFCILKDG